MCKLNPKIDLVFKKIFGTEHNKNVLKSLINSILPQDEQVVELTIKNPYNETDFVGDKLSVVDIKATDENGKWYDIEIQIKEQKYYGKRAIFYHSEIYGNQLSEGDTYDKLRKTIIISILDFDYFLKDKRYFRRCCYKDFETGELYPELDYADLYFIELRKFDNDLKNIKTTLDRWITFLNKATEYEKDTLPSELNEPEIIQAFDTIETMNLNTKEREYYEAEKKVMRDRASHLLTAVENAVDNRNMEIVINGIKEGFTNDIISKMTKFTDTQINEIRNKLDNK
jgi:predicted transposase/invertase (TIGR01784 family)